MIVSVINFQSCKILLHRTIHYCVVFGGLTILYKIMNMLFKLHFLVFISCLTGSCHGSMNTKL